MPDISMCKNEECPLRNQCYRYTAVPEVYQSYASFKPDENGKCDYFIEMAQYPDNNN
jgi:hypothetical protein